MQGDVDTVRGGQAGVVTMSLAKKLEGNPDAPGQPGRALCPRGQAAIQIAYHPDRIKKPLKRRGAKGSGDFQPITWDAAIAELVAQLDAHPHRVCLTRPGAERAPRRAGAARRALRARRGRSYELFSDDVLRRANEMSFGRAQLPTFDLAASRYAISFGADFLGTWNSPVAHTAAYGRMRQGRPGIRGSFVQVEPRMSLTGASADEWVADPARHRRRPGARPRARDHARQAAAGRRRRSRRARSSTAGRRASPTTRRRPSNRRRA